MDQTSFGGHFSGIEAAVVVVAERLGEGQDLLREQPDVLLGQVGRQGGELRQTQQVLEARLMMAVADRPRGYVWPGNRNVFAGSSDQASGWRRRSAMAKASGAAWYKKAS